MKRATEYQAKTLGVSKGGFRFYGKLFVVHFKMNIRLHNGIKALSIVSENKESSYTDNMMREKYLISKLNKWQTAGGIPLHSARSIASYPITWDYMRTLKTSKANLMTLNHHKTLDSIASHFLRHLIN